MKTEDSIKTNTRPRHRITHILFLFITLFLMILPLVELTFAVPVFVDLFSDFSAKLPASTEFARSCSKILSGFYATGFVFLTMLSIGIISWIYSNFRKTDDRGLFFVRLWIITFFSIVFIVLVTISMFVPMSTVDNGIVM
jgi:type II secretory pathway component PulF